MRLDVGADEVDTPDNIVRIPSGRLIVVTRVAIVVGVEGGSSGGLHVGSLLLLFLKYWRNTDRSNADSNTVIR